MHDKLRSALPPPTNCNNCASTNVEFKSNAALYGREFGEWPYCYHCADCNAAVGCHPGTKIPLGRLADKRTRQKRAETHSHFDPIWKCGAMGRTEAYKLLARHLNIDHQECHISQLNIEQLEAAISFCKDLAANGDLELLTRRREKKNAKQLDRNNREKRAEHRFSKYTKRNSSARRARRSEPNGETDS